MTDRDRPAPCAEMPQKHASSRRTFARQEHGEIAPQVELASMHCPSVVAASAVLLVALPARAERAHDTVTLTYLPSRAAIALCPEADYLENEVFVRLRYALFQPNATKHLTVKVDRTSGMFRATDEMRDDEGNVLFSGTYAAMDCTFAVFSIAVALSVHYAELPEPPPQSPPEPPPPSPVEAPPLGPPEPKPPPPPIASPRPERRSFQAGLASVFAAGTAPTVIGGIGGFLGLRWPNVSLALEGRALFAPSATTPQSNVREGYQFTFTAISGSACYHLAWALVCARAQVGSLSSGNSSVKLGPTHMTILGLGLLLGGERTLTPWLALRAYVEVLGQPISGALKSDRGTPPFWSQTGLSGSVGLGPVFTFSGM